MVSKVARQQWGIGRGLGKTCVCGVMKWYVIVWLVTARLSGGSVLRCTSDSKDASCISENQDKVTELKKEDLPSGKDCAPSTAWKTECNSCYCRNGHVFCTLVYCENEKYLSCAPGSRWKNDCNICQCSPDGQPVCTKMDCVPQSDLDVLDPVNFEPEVPEKVPDKNENVSVINTSATLVRKVRASQEPQKTCQPGTEFRLDCNKCLCDNEGQDFSCTRIDCNALNNNGNGGGRTKREEAKREATELEPRSAGPAPGTAVDTNFRCNPGEQYSHDCNDCTCSADGKSTFCTLRLCDKNLSPE